METFLQIGKIIFPFVVLTIVFFQAKRISGHFFLEAIDTIKNIPTGGVFLAITLGAFAVSTMFFYDYVMLRYLKADIPVQRFSVSRGLLIL